ncbi:MAG: molybdopterin cofactor-binding domain-containing protein, partial [Pseudomonadota bacterium]
MNKFAHYMRDDAKSDVAEQTDALQLTRRGFLIGAAGAGVTLAFTHPQAAFAEANDAVADGAYEGALWFRIEQDGKIIVRIAESEMGQHVGTALARIVADELEADWADVTVDYVDADAKWGYMVTGGSWSVHQNFTPLSQAGAAGRMVMIEEGARLLGVEPSKCKARESKVIAGRKSITYAEIVSRGNLTREFTAEQLAEMPIKPASQRRLIGKDAPALDIPDKTRGTAVYGIDAEVDGMVFGRPLMPPTRYGAKVTKMDDTAAKRVKGYQRTVVLEDPSGTVPGWAVVIADSFHAANRAASLIDIEWEAGETASVSEEDILAEGRKVIGDASKGALVWNDEGVDEAFAGADSTLEAEYTTHSVLHFQLEPLNALAYQREDGAWELHTGNQWQNLILPTLAQALETEESKLNLRTYLLGGGFGRRLNGDYIVPAALASKALGGKPVKLVFTREDDSRFDSMRSAS